MNITTWMLLICTGLTLAALTWWGCAWWYGRKLGDLQQRFEKVRQAAGQHATQARRQIAQLQQELAGRPPLDKTQRAARDEAAEAAARKAELESRLDAAGPVSRPAHGFADTQPMF